MAERPPATDLRGGNASEDSFTRLMANLVVAYAVDFQSDLLSGATSGSTVSSGDFGRLPWSLPRIGPGTGRIWFETVEGSVFRKRRS
jgi:hypothetical protein